MVPVRKPDGSIRLCIDYRHLNSVTQPDPYTMPRVQDLLGRISQARWLSKLDPNKGFYQIPLVPESVPKTAFCSPWGKFAFTRMPFGLMKVPTSFQRVMDEALAWQENSSCTCIDDIVVFSETWDGHLKHVRAVLEALKQTGMTANPGKCTWSAQTITYLGHRVGRGLFKVPEARITAIKNYKQSVTKRDLRAFLGSVGHYCSCVPDFAGRAVPLYNALKKVASSKLEWTGDMYDAYDYFFCIHCAHTMCYASHGRTIHLYSRLMHLTEELVQSFQS